MLKENIMEQFSVNITNNNTYDMKNIEFDIDDNDNDQYFQFPDYTNISINETKEIRYNVTSDFTGTKDITVKIKHYRSYNTTSNPQTHIVGIYTNMIDPTIITIKKNDIINFTNNVGYSINIHEQENNQWNFNINENSSYIKEYNAVEYIRYIANDIFLGMINVTDNTLSSLEHFTSDDIDITMRLVSSLTDADITMTNLGSDNYTIDWDMNISSSVLVNTNDFISNLTLTSNLSTILNFTFTPNMFDISSPAVIQYSIRPIINETNRTNCTYNVSIEASSDNSNTVILNLSVYIPYKDLSILEGNTTVYLVTEEQIKAYMPIYCAEHQDKCIGQTKLVYLNQTEDEIDVKIAEINNKITTIDNKIINIGDKINSLNNNVSIVVTLSQWLESKAKDDIQKQEQEKKETTVKTVTKVLLWSLGIIILLAVGLIYGFKLMRDRNVGSVG